ncbi:MAG: winged helix DNA-binding domain-containing protein [Acidimicrobiia bacterium]
MLHVDTTQRRARLGRRHHLARRAGDVEGVAAALVGLHSSDPATVHLAARARVRRFGTTDLERALYDDRVLLRVLGMRRTMFVTDLDGAGVMHAACTRALVAGERTRLVRLLEGQGIARDGARWLRRVGDATVAAIDARGTATAAELATVGPELGERLRMGEGRSWAATVGVSTRMLFLLATEGRIVRARPRGSWTSSQYEWATRDAWVGPLPEPAPEPARVELLRRWLATFGPGTLRDIMWWTGWSRRHTEAALTALDAVAVELDDGVGFVLADDTRSVRAPASWVALLPGLDPTVMGWKDRDWYLDPAHVPHLFDRSGNAGPTVWVDGRVVGGWAQRRDGEVLTRLLEPVDAAACAAIAAEAAALAEWMNGTVVTPRFATPLEKSLRS